MKSTSRLRTLRRAAVSVALLAVTCAVPIGIDSATSAADAATTDVDWGDLDTTGLIGPNVFPDPGAMTFLIGLVTDDAGIEAKVRSVSEPMSPEYGTRTTVAQLADRYGASLESRNAVVDYFADTFGVEAVIDPTGSYATVDLLMTQAEVAFSTQWAMFEFPTGSYYDTLDVQMLYPTTPPTLPAALSGHVDAVDGAVVAYQLPDPPADTTTTSNAAKAAGGDAFRTGVASGCTEALDQPTGLPGTDFGFAPNQLLSAYQFDQLQARGVRGQGMRVAVVDNALYPPEWLATYRSCFGLDGSTPVTDHVIGTPASDVDSMTETILDLSVMSFAAPQVDRFDVFMVGTAQSPVIEDVVAGLISMLGAPLDATQTGGTAPDVISASYGACESSPLYWQGRTAAVGIMERVFATAAAAGITYVVSTGDSGSTGCFHNLPGVSPETTAVTASYPATSKWVTAVGGTNLTLAADNSIVSSGAWNDTQYGIDPSVTGGAGGGGVSTVVERPWYQQRTSPTATGRSVPDISLYADELPGYLLYTGSWSYEGGTSAATPLFSGMAILLSQEARAAGQPTLGFANPLLYALGEQASPSLLDITLGTNDMFSVGCCPATPGYDLATGWGSPLAQSLSSTLAAPAVTVTGVGSTDGSLTATFTANVATTGGQIRSYRWDTNGDGLTDATTTGPTLTTTATVAGVQTTRLSVDTTLGRVGAGTASATVSVSAPRPPIAAQVPRSLAFAG